MKDAYAKSTPALAADLINLSAAVEFTTQKMIGIVSSHVVSGFLN